MMKTYLLLLPLAVSAWELGDSFDNVPTPVGKPGPAPEYAKNNINNREGVAPDKGVLDGPVLAPLNETLLAMIHNNAATESMSGNISSAIHSTVDARDGTDYWLPGVAGKGVMPLAPAGYQFYRNVKDFGAVGDGQTDDTAAINRAVAAFSKDNTEKTRCGKECGSSTTLQALVYFPPGKYLVSTPIIQYYHTQFVGNPNNKPTLKGAANFSGIAIVDNDVYIPGGNGAEWYINQSNFLRQIRNIDFDLLDMSNGNNQGDQSYTPTGIHWQVGQATSIENCNFRMPVSTGSGSTTAVGIFMENGSGGTMSDLNFFGGNIGIIAGSQQFTATNLHFLSCLTGVKQLWNWGFVYKNILMINVKVGFDLTAYSDASKQGVGSISLIDSTFANVPQPITVGPDANHRPSLVLDKISASNSGPVVSVPGGEAILGPGAVEQWISGYQVLPGEMQGQKRSGVPNPVLKRPYKLVSGHDERYFYQVKPHYGSSSNVFVVTDMGVKNDGTGDQTDAINKILSERMPGEITYFPAGIYQVQGTVHVPVGAIIVGSSWSQIQASGHYFADDDNPRVMVQVGTPGDRGSVEISDMLFTVKGPTAGCILMEWNIREIVQGEAAMWDSHFRVGGAAGAGLGTADCPAKTNSPGFNCKAASLMLHLTPESSGYFQNVWAWVADHDLDDPANAEAYETDDGIPRNVATQVSVYAGRGVLIESNGPTWFYGSASEHSQMYQYQLLGASNIFFGHMQTETPYYQPNPTANEPFLAGQFPSDPTFFDCKDGDGMCETAWALRILDSINIVIYGAGFYSFFQNNELGCTEHESCQKAMIQTSFSEYVYMYNIFTKGNQEVVTPAAAGHVKSLLFDDSTRNGYTSEVAAWLPLALDPAADWGDNDISAGTDTGDGDNDIDDRPVCDFSRHFNSLEEIANADDLSSMCRALLSFPLLVDKLDQIYVDYQEANKGYDEVFPYYEKYFRYIANEMIANCTTEQDPIFHCKDENGPWESCEALFKRVVWDDYYTITWECLDRDKYESALLKDYAIPKDWVQYANKSNPFHCHNPGHAIDWDCSDKNHTNYNMPMLADHVDVPNPKDIIARAGERFSSVKTMLFATYADMLLSQWSGPYEDALDTLSTPVSLLAQAVQSMKDDKEIGEAIHEQEVRNNILNILGIIFSVLPFAGDLLLPFGVTFSFVGKIIGLIGEVGDQALNIYSVTQSPETAPLALMGGLMGFLGPRIPKYARTGAGFKDLKPAKDIINEQGIMGKYGKVAKAFNDQIGKILKACGK